MVVTATNPDGTAAVADHHVCNRPGACGRGGAGPLEHQRARTGTTSHPAQRQVPAVAFGGQAGVSAQSLTVTGSVFAGAPVTGAVTRVMRCTHKCVAVGAPNTRTYKIRAADAGAVLRITETA